MKSILGKLICNICVAFIGWQICKLLCSPKVKQIEELGFYEQILNKKDQETQKGGFRIYPITYKNKICSLLFSERRDEATDSTIYYFDPERKPFQY